MRWRKVVVWDFFGCKGNERMHWVMPQRTYVRRTRFARSFVLCWFGFEFEEDGVWAERSMVRDEGRERERVCVCVSAYAYKERGKKNPGYVCIYVLCSKLSSAWHLMGRTEQGTEERERERERERGQRGEKKSSPPCSGWEFFEVLDGKGHQGGL